MTSDERRQPFFTRFAIGFSNSFGTAKAFGLTTALVLVWLAIMPWVGVAQWNASWGLAGNTTESTIELFLAIAVQYTTNRVERHQRSQITTLESAVEHIEQMEEALHDRMTAEFVSLTSLINELNPKLLSTATGIIPGLVETYTNEALARQQKPATREAESQVGATQSREQQ